MKTIIENISPKIVYRFVRAIVRYIRLGRCYLYDLNHFYKHSMSIDNAAENKMISKIILDTHVIEKGLTMPSINMSFGSVRVSALLTNIANYTLNYDKDNPQLLHAFSVVNEYFIFHEIKNYTINDNLVEQFRKVCELEKICKLKFENRHQIETSKKEYFKKISSEFSLFSNSRSSIRNFSSAPISRDRIKSILSLCRNAPSACNRQSVRVHLYRDKNSIKEILGVQGGNRGFGHLASLLIIITYESSVYFEQSERNSGFVDGGIYCMNLLYFLHANGIAACILNAAHNGKKDIKMREVSNIPASEGFVAMVACGIPPEKFKIARSFRYPLEYIMVEH